MRSTLKWIFILGFLGAVGWVAFKWYAHTPDISADALSLVPSDAIYYITTNDPVKSWKEIARSGAWAHLQKNAYFAALTASANSLDSLIHDNDLLFDLIGSRALLVSAHMTSAKEYDFLFLVDLKEVSGIKFLNEYLTSFSTEGFSVRKQKYGEEDLVILKNPAENTDLYLAMPGTFLLASYSKKIITAALDSREGTDNLAAMTFLKEGDNIAEGGILKFYMNYAMLPQFMTAYSNGTNEYVDRLSKALHTTSLSMTVEDELLKATGHTYVNDSVESYLKTLAISGSGATEFTEIAPQRTAFCLGLGFSTFREFFANFEKNLQEDVAAYKDYRDNLKQVENYLNIDLQENFINWIGDEVALLELQSHGKGVDNETALVLKAENIEKARKDLEHIEKMVRKKTPVKFKSVDHRGYKINYLSMKGLFRALLGKFFARFDKPYYTIVNNFVIFSNHPQTLKSIIDDYLDKNTLIKSEEFRAFRKEFDDEGSVFIYLNTPVLFNTVKKLVDNPTRADMESNKAYIVCFRQVGFQLVPGSGGFKTTLAEQFMEPEPRPILVAEASVAADTLISAGAEPVEEPIGTAGSDPMELPYIYAQDLSKTSYSAYFPDSTIQLRVELKNGFKDGSYTEYHPNGEVKMKGHFRHDQRDGLWRLYDEERTKD
jgi:hypothetical protein